LFYYCYFNNKYIGLQDLQYLFMQTKLPQYGEK